MSKETKFGYGFLLAGIGTPYLIFEVFGFKAAVVAASFCIVAGIALLIAGHRHKEQGTRRGVMATIGFYTLIGLLVGASTGAIAGIALVLKQKFSPELATETKTAENKPQQLPASSEVATTTSRPGNRAAHETHTNNVLSPYARTQSFIIDVPYYGAEDGFPISQTWQEDYPLTEAYGCVAKVLILYAQAPPGTGIKQIAVLDTNDKRAQALAEALRYCLIERIYTSERGSTKFGISSTKGSIADYRPAIMPPHSTDYPAEKFLALLETLPFGKSERIQMLYRRPLRVPEGSSVELLVAKMDDNDFVNHWIFGMKRPGAFKLAFGVAPINAAIGVLPESFPAQYKPQQSKYTTYSFAITIKVEIQRTTTNVIDVEDFTRWSDGLWAAIRDKFDIKRLQ